MENLRQVVLGVSFFKTELHGKSFVVAFDEVDEVHQYVPKQFIAQAWSGQTVLQQPVIVLAAASLEDDRRVVTHELTHVISYNVIQNQPAWFAEGLAGYFETVRLDENRSTLDVGVPIEGRFRQLHEDGMTAAAAVFACTNNDCKNDRFYATTWALVTYLLNEHLAEFMRYMQRLMETPASEQAQLWASVFPNLPPEKLDHELATWVRYGHIKVMKYNIVLREWPVTERPITEADVWAAKGLLRYLYAPTAGSPSEIARALALDPTHVIANMIDARAKKEITPELAATITAAHPDDWRAWWLAWRASRTGTESRAAREKTCTLLDADPAATPIEACARDATGAFAEDPRKPVFMQALPQINDCLKKSSVATNANLTIEIEIADSGAVTAAHVSIASQDANRCIEDVLKALKFPPHHSGTYHMAR